MRARLPCAEEQGPRALRRCCDGAGRRRGRKPGVGGPDEREERIWTSVGPISTGHGWVQACPCPSCCFCSSRTFFGATGRYLAGVPPKWLAWLAPTAYAIHQFEEYGISFEGVHFAFPDVLCASMSMPPHRGCALPESLYISINMPIIWLAGMACASLSRRHFLVGLGIYGLHCADRDRNRRKRHSSRQREGVRSRAYQRHDAARCAVREPGHHGDVALGTRKVRPAQGGSAKRNFLQHLTRD